MASGKKTARASGSGSKTSAARNGPRRSKTPPRAARGPRDASPRPADAPARSPGLPGLAARRLAVRLIEAVLIHRHALDDALDAEERAGRTTGIEARDRAFAHMIAATVLRRQGSLSAVLDRFLERPLPGEAARARLILLAAAAQILLLETPPHAAINLAVEHCRRDRAARRFDKLANAVLRRVAKDGPAIIAAQTDPDRDIPAWIWDRWVAAYGAERAADIAAASLREAPLDITARADAALWADRLSGTVLPTGSIRLATHARVEDLPGFSEGMWWVQDAAASLPARLLGDVAGLQVADLCAAPGGKTAMLAAAGALVTAVDLSAPRLQRVTANMARLGLAGRVETVAADITTWMPGRVFDAVLLDAPCTATGTIRRHPDILHLKRPEDIARLARLQGDMLRHAATLVKPGGRLVYCTCSLEPEEGASVIEAFLAANPQFTRHPIRPGEIGIPPDWLTDAGDLRTLPCHLAAEGGMDGFFAARLMRGQATL